MLAGLGEHFAFINESLNLDLDDIQQSFTAARHDFFVAESGEGIIGAVGVLYEAGQPRIVRMSVQAASSQRHRWHPATGNPVCTNSRILRDHSIHRTPTGQMRSDSTRATASANTAGMTWTFICG